MTWKSYRTTRVAAKGTLFTQKGISRLLLPLIIEQFLNNIVGLADSIMVSSAGEAAISAVSLIDGLSVLVVNIFASLAAGGAIVVGQYLGQGSHGKARNAAQHLVVTLLALALIATALMLCFEVPILHALFGKAEVAVQSNCQTYYHIVMLSIPCIALYNAGAVLFRSTGDSKTPMRISLLMNCINIAGNATLIYGLRIGVAGVAIPTLISRTVAMIIVIALAMRRRFPLSLLGLWHSHFDGNLVRKVLSTGIPNGLETAMFQMGKVLLSSLVSTLPTVAITANAIGNTIASMTCVVGLSVNLGLYSVISQCAGTKDFRQARWYTEYMVGFTYKVQGIVCALFMAAIPLILRMYHASSEVASLATAILLIDGVATMLLWPLAFNVNTAMRAAGDVRNTMVVASISMWLCRVGLGYFFVTVLHAGVLGIWYAWVIDWFFRIAFFLPRYFGTKWETKTIV